MKHKEKPMAQISPRPVPYVAKFIEEHMGNDDKQPEQGRAAELKSDPLPAAAEPAQAGESVEAAQKSRRTKHQVVTADYEKTGPAKKNKKSANGFVRLSIDLDPDFHTALRMIALKEKVTLAEVGRDLYEKWLAKHQSKPK